MTAQDYLNLAYAKSKKNVPGKIVAESTEGLDLVNRVIRMMCQLGVRVNPGFFTDDADVTYDLAESTGIGWPRPALAEAVLLIHDSLGSEVRVVPWDDRQAEKKRPAVYRKGRHYLPAGNDLDPDSGDVLTFWFARRPEDVVDLGDSIDLLYPEAYAELPAYELATIFAIKDGRPDDVQYLIGERDNWLRMFIAFLQHETMNETRRWDTRFNLPSAMPIMLAGGTSVAMPGGGA